MKSIDLICKLADEFLEESIPHTVRSPISDFPGMLRTDIEVVNPLTPEQISAKSNFSKKKEKALLEAFLRIEMLARSSAKTVELGDKDSLFRSTKGTGIAKNVEIMSDFLDVVKNIAGLE